MINSLKSEFLLIEQEMIDRSAVGHVVNCQSDHVYNEDECLYKCLTKKFISEFGCLHARLARVTGISEQFRHIRHCGLQVSFKG